MKKFVILAVAVLLCAGMVASADAQPTIRVGGGLIFDGTVWGGGAAVDIPVGEQPFKLSPFFEYYKKSGVSTIPFGLNALYSIRPMGDEGGTVYFGGGGGAVRVSGGPVSTTKYLIDGVGGATVPVAETFSLYGEVKWIYSNDINLNDISATVGIAFSLGSE